MHVYVLLAPSQIALSNVPPHSHFVPYFPLGVLSPEKSVLE